MKQTSIRLSDDMMDAVKRVASSEGRTPHWIMCEAIRQYVESHETVAGCVAGNGEAAKTISPETVALIHQEIEKRVSSLWDAMTKSLDDRFKATPDTRLPFDESLFKQGGIVTDDAPVRRLVKMVVEKTRKMKPAVSGKPETA